MILSFCAAFYELLTLDVEVAPAIRLERIRTAWTGMMPAMITGLVVIQSGCLSTS